MVLRTGGVCIIKDGRHAMAWRFAQLDITVDYGFEDQLLEVAFHFIVYLIGQSQT